MEKYITQNFRMPENNPHTNKYITQNSTIPERIPHAENITLNSTIPERIPHAEKYKMGFHTQKIQHKIPYEG